jgi:hypothetical protein
MVIKPVPKIVKPIKARPVSRKKLVQKDLTTKKLVRRPELVLFNKRVPQAKQFKFSEEVLKQVQRMHGLFERQNFEEWSKTFPATIDRISNNFYTHGHTWESIRKDPKLLKHYVFLLSPKLTELRSFNTELATEAMTYLKTRLSEIYRLKF